MSVANSDGTITRTGLTVLSRVLRPENSRGFRHHPGRRLVHEAHAKTVIERWRQEYNEERPKKSLGGLTPAAYAKQLAHKAVMTCGSIFGPVDT